MKNKFISIVSLLCIISGLFTGMCGMVSAAEKYSDAEKAELLYALGILESTEDAVVTKGVFIGMMSRLYSQNDMNSGAFGIAMEMVFESEDTKDEVSYIEAVKYAVITLGYKSQADLNGGTDEAYIKQAAALKISDGISASSKKAISFKDAVTLIYNMLDVSPMIQDISKGRVEYKVLEDETILSYKHDIDIVRGIVTHTPVTSLYSADGCADGQIGIDGEYYENSNSAYNDCLGSYVEAYVNLKELEVVYMIPRRTESVTVDAEEIYEVDIKANTFTYETETKNKILKLSVPLKVIYNEKFYSDYTDADFMPSIGNVKLIDNNRDGRYEVAFITSYEEMILESKDSVDKTLVNELKFDGALESITLEGDEETVFEIFKNDAPAAFGELKNGDSILVKRSRSEGEKAVSIYASDKRIEDVLSGFYSEDNEIKIGEEIYKMTDAAVRLGQKDEITGEAELSFELGKKYVFYLNSFGEIAYAEEKLEMDYYLFFKAYEDEGDDYGFAVNYMDMNEEWHTARLHKKVRFGKEICTTESVFIQIKDKKPQPVIMKFNSNGDIKEIQFAEDTEKSMKDTFTRTGEKSGYYYGAQGTLDYNIFAETGAYVIVMPTEENYMNREEYSVYPVTSYFFNDKRYSNVRAYDIDEFKFSPLFTTVKTDDNLISSVSTSLFLVKDINTAAIDDEVFTQICGDFGRFVNYELIVKDDSIISGISEGDLVKFHLNDDGMVDYCVKVTSLAGTFNEVWAGPQTNSSIISATIKDIDVQKQRMVLSIGGGDRILRIIGTNTIVFYDSSRGTTNIGSFSEIVPGDKVVFNMSWGQIKEAYCVRD